MTVQRERKHIYIHDTKISSFDAVVMKIKVEKVNVSMEMVGCIQLFVNCMQNTIP